MAAYSGDRMFPAGDVGDQESRFHLDATVVRPPESGVHRAVREQVLSLLRTEIAPRCVIHASAPDLLEAAANAGATPAPVPRLTRSPLLRILWQQFRLPGKLRQQKPATVPARPVLHAMAYTAPLLCRVPVVLNLHDVIAFDHPDMCSLRNRIHMHALVPASVRRAARIIVSTHAIAARLPDLFGIDPERIVVAPLGVRSDMFSGPRPLPVQFRELLHPHAYVLFVGNIEPKKGIEVLLGAYERVAEELRIPLVLAGRFAWKSRAIRRRIRRFSGPGRIVCTGWIEDAALTALYANAWAFVFPSHTEGFGLPVIEAMAAGVPVIHSDDPSVLEVAGNAGLPFTRGNPESLARALRHLARTHGLRERLIADGRLRAAAFTWDEWAAKANAVLLEVSADAARRPDA